MFLSKNVSSGKPLTKMYFVAQSREHPRQKVYLVRNMSGSNSCYTYKKTIYDIGTEILKFQCLNCFKTPLFCKSIIPEDSKISRRDLSFASVKSRFKSDLLIKWIFRLSMKFTIFVHQHFDSLPPKIWSYRNVIFFTDSSRWCLSSYKVSKG